MKVLFYPDPPVQYPGHTLSKTISYFQSLNYSLTNDINDEWDIGVHWFRGNKSSVLLNDNYFLSRMTDGFRNPIINSALNDVTKSYVDYIFTQVFGYSSLGETVYMKRLRSAAAWVSWGIITLAGSLTITESLVIPKVTALPRTVLC
jgi:hypothetical protein